MDDREGEIPSAERMHTDSMMDMQAALEAVLTTQSLNNGYDDPVPVKEEPVESDFSAEMGEIELAMPSRTADELLQEAYTNGDDPSVTKDPITGVTFIDYSDCL